MASWIVHLRIAEEILNRVQKLSEVEFTVGNIAPDSGVPNENWTVFTPSTDISHFKLTGVDDKNLTSNKKLISTEKFISKYLPEDKLAYYTREQLSFYLGYLCHLMTDLLWIDHVFDPTAKRDPEFSDSDRSCVQKWKKDWYDLDFLYLKKNPDFPAFLRYKNAVGFKNVFMDEFSLTAFDERRKYICEFYSEPHELIDREYPYLTEEQMSAFVRNAADIIYSTITLKFNV